MKKNDLKKFSRMSQDALEKFMSLPKPVALNMLKRVNYIFYLAKEEIIAEAVKQNILTKEEYENSYKDMFYDSYGSDSFIQYINAVMNGKNDCFVTENERMIKRKEKLKERFGLRVASPEEIVKETGDKQCSGAKIK